MHAFLDTFLLLRTYAAKMMMSRERGERATSLPVVLVLSQKTVVEGAGAHAKTA